MNLSKTLFASLLSLALLTTNVWAESVNVNKADAETLASSLNGIGMVRANDIVKFRKDFGKFKTVEDLLKVKGVGEKILNKNRHDILLKDSK